jgi:UDP-glucose 4-epimerase
MQRDLDNEKRAIVLGANGYLGRNLCYHLLSEGYLVLAVGRQETFALDTYPNKSHLQYLQADLVIPSQVQKVAFNFADVIYVLAGKTGTLDGFERYDEYIESNEIALLNVLAAYRLQKAKARVIFPSTRLVYRGSEEPLLESAAKNPKTIYAINKLACEKYLNSYSISYGIPYTVMRICVPYGSLVEGQYSYGTIGVMMRQATEAKKITLFGDGSQRRTFTHMQDICQILENICHIESTNQEIFNIGGSDHLSMEQVSQYFAARFNAYVAHQDWPADYWAIESGSTVFDDQKLQAVCPHEYGRNLSGYIANL